MMTKVLEQTLNLKNLTTLKVGGPAEVWEVETLEDLQEATKQLYRVIGAGSNLLVSDEGVKERVIKLGQTFNSLKDFKDQTNIWLGASTPLPGLIRRAQQAGLSGLEGLLGVPAVLGGAIAMNAGTRYGEMSDTLQEVEVFVNGGLERLPASALGLRYRHSEIPQGAIITRAKLKLTPSTPEAVQAKLDQVDAARKGQPKQKSAGCAFKNPIGYGAGKLIDEAGLKGTKVGDAMVSLEHGNFIVNLGNATAKDVLALLDLIRHRISIKYNDAVALETEWQLWGF
jgi:UDP-N-acetylmuramate dehydrogenase